ncbi:MAG: MgtC/SapB family protein [Thermaerobacterales bacterium]
MLVLDLQDIIFRLLAAVALSGAIGWERESHQRPAGLRTHMLVGVGAGLLMILSQEIYLTFRYETMVDPGRIAAQVVSGIGFLGAGTILREGASIRGLTTAASLWVVAAIGLAAGAAAYTAAVATTLIVLVTLIFLRSIERGMAMGRQVRSLNLRVDDRPGQLGEIGTVLGNYHVDIRQIEVNPAGGAGLVELRMNVVFPAGLQHMALSGELTALPGVHGLEIE